MTDYHFGPLFRFIEDTAIYMESGYLDMLSTAPCNINTARPAVLNYSTPTGSYVTSTITPLQGRVSISTDISLDEFPFTGQALTDGYESKSVGCTVTQKTASVSDECGNTYTVAPELVATQGFCPIAPIYTKKRAQANVPSSMFSGKLRLMVQAIYGSTRTDYEVIESAGLVVPGKLLVGGFVLSALYQPSYGIFTSPDYEYWLVELTSIVKYYPLSLSSMGQQLATILKDHPRKTELAFAKKVEAYILSTATIDQVNVITGGALDVIGGSVLYYGWHWKWDGSEADVVVQSEDYTNHRYNTTRYKLQITRTDGVFSEVLTVEQSGYWWPQTLGLNVFVPEPIIGKTVVKLPILETLNNGIPVPGNEGVIPTSPIHCFRSMSDELIVVEYSCNFTIRTDTVNDYTPIACRGDLGIMRDLKTYNGLSGSNSFSLGAESHVGTMATLASRNLDTVQYFPPFWIVQNSKTPTSDVVCGGESVGAYLFNNGYYNENGTRKATGETVFANGQDRTVFYQAVTCNSLRHYVAESNLQDNSSTTPVFLHLPYLDCSSVFWGFRDTSSKTHHKYGEEDQDSNTFAALGVIKTYFDGNTSIFLPLVTTPVYLTASYTGLDNIAVPTLIGDVSTHTAHASLYIYHNNGDSSEEVYSIDTPAPLPEYFDIQYFEYPFVDHLDWVQEDTSGGYKFSYKFSIPNDATYPGDSAVGWV